MALLVLSLFCQRPCMLYRVRSGQGHHLVQNLALPFFHDLFFDRVGDGQDPASVPVQTRFNARLHDDTQRRLGQRASLEMYNERAQQAKPRRIEQDQGILQKRLRSNTFEPSGHNVEKEVRVQGQEIEIGDAPQQAQCSRHDVVSVACDEPELNKRESGVLSIPTHRRDQSELRAL